MDSNSKSRKTHVAESDSGISCLSWDPLLYPPNGNIPSEEDVAFDETMDKLLPDFLDTRLSLQEEELECDDKVVFVSLRTVLQNLNGHQPGLLP